jgi:hypothetical protein
MIVLRKILFCHRGMAAGEKKVEDLAINRGGERNSLGG